MLAQGDDIIPIPGSKDIAYNEENIRSVEIKLSAEEMGKILEAVEKAEKVLGGDLMTTPFGATIAFVETPPYEG